MTSLHLVPKAIPDATERALALDITRSFLVEAPAGSGKTGLLIQRFLKLLASESVEDPRQVLAITFTRKATAEMLERVLGQLAAAAAGTEPANAFDRATRPMAEAVVARDAQLGWKLLDNPGQLNIRTIDSLSNEIAAALPILSGSGGAQSPTDDAAPLFAEAARRTVMLLGGEDRALTDALETLLLHRDGNLANCEDLIARMLATRDQWGGLVPLAQQHLNDRYLDEVVLPKLDRALDLAICRTLARLAEIFPAHVLDRLTTLAAEMGSLDGYKGAASPVALCARVYRSPAAVTEHLEHWRALIHLLVKPSKPRDFRKSVSANHIGFEILKHHQADLKQIVAELSDTGGLLDALCQIDALPPAAYPREQWPVAKALFRVLARALTELQLVFADRGQCDFAEVGLLARTALRNDSAMDDLAASSGSRLQHLLVDEMQDTSTGQYEFIQLLTRRWDGHGQTVFLVGDPKQSIYLFREARVERFVRTLLTAQLGDLPLTVLHLTANFRSQAALVESFNDDFRRVFPAASDPSQPEQIPYQAAHAVRDGVGRRIWHANPVPDDGEADPSLHAATIREVILTWRAKPLPDGRSAAWRIAVLVRNRAHLSHIVAALKQAPAIPYRAVEIDSLGERPEVLDLLALTRALLHPADRTAWLALLRSPVCGLSLADLHRLAAASPEETIFHLMDLRGADLSDDGIARLEPFWQVIDEALRQRGRARLTAWVANTWRSFGWPSYLAPEALANAESYFRLLDQLEQPGPSIDLERLHAKVAKLYAAPSVAPDAVDLMTLHKAKGLEWDVVLVPELHRAGRNNESKLLAWLETSPDDLAEEDVAAGILAPIASRGTAAAALNSWMRRVDADREAAERKRLFYVASTRAREELYLFAAPKRNRGGELKPKPGSLLHAAWAAAEPHFAAPVIGMPRPVQAGVLSLAAAASPRTVQRIPLGARPVVPASLPPFHEPSFVRPEGSFAARAFGNTLHAFLELAAAQLISRTAADLTAELPVWQPRISAVLRGSGLGTAEIARLAGSVLRGLTKALNDPEGAWVLAPHPESVSESAFTTLSDEPATRRLDRSFLAGPTPLSSGATHLWIVDYKTATHGSEHLAAFLHAERRKYAAQLETYAHELAPRSLHPIRLALYYPMLPHLIWWEPGMPLTEAM